MASTARSEEEKREYFDPPEELDKKATLLATWIRESKHMIAFTGAGISTSAGIPDFRSGMNTKVETGPGKWELQAHKATRSAAIEQKLKATTQAIPTPTHMMLVKLVEEGLLKAVVSQNCDGLHRRSGLPVGALFELHGNTNVERCRKCKKEYLRDFRVKGLKKLRHNTGRTCDNPQCGGTLRDTIIHFGESLPEKTLDRSIELSEISDLCLAMGSSLTVTPAADIPETVGEKQRLVIVNLQATPLDDIAALRVHAKCDDFTNLLMVKLGLEIPPFQLWRRLLFKTASKGRKVIVEQIDTEGHPFSYLKQLEFKGVVSKPCVPGKDPLECAVPPGGGEVGVQLTFQAHYGEPDVLLNFQVLPGKDITVDVMLSYDPHTRSWSISRSDQPVASGPGAGSSKPDQPVPSGPAGQLSSKPDQVVPSGQPAGSRSGSGQPAATGPTQPSTAKPGQPAGTRKSGQTATTSNSTAKPVPSRAGTSTAGTKKSGQPAATGGTSMAEEAATLGLKLDEMKFNATMFTKNCKQKH